MTNKIRKRTNEIASNYFWRALQLLSRQGMTFIIFIIAAKLLSPNELGELSFSLVVVLLLSTFSDFGISNSVSRYASEYKSANNKKLRDLIPSGFIAIVLMSIVATLFFILFGGLILKEYYWNSLILLPLIFLVPLVGLYDGVFRGLKKFKVLSIASIVPSLILLPIVFFLIKKYGLIGALVSQVLLYVVLLIVIALSFGYPKGTVSRKVLKEVVSYAIFIGLANLSYLLYTRMVVLFLGYFNFIEQVAYYELTNRLFLVVINVFATLGVVIAPSKIEMKLKNKKSVKKNAMKYFIFSFIFGILTTTLIILLVPYLVSNFFPAYNNQVFLRIFYLVSLILPLYIVEAVISNGFITPLGYVKTLLYPTLGGLVLAFLLFVTVLETHGYIGIILAFVFVTNLVNVVKIVYFFKKLPS